MSGDREFLEGYDPRAFPPVAVTVDVAVLTLRGHELSLLLVERGERPFRGSWALPGGFVRPDEGLVEAARREVTEETGIAPFEGHLEQLETFGDPGRDPRMRVVSVAFLVVLPDLGRPQAGTDAAGARYWPVADLPPLAFDHADVVAAAVERTRAKLEYSPLATAFCAEPFTLGELRRVYEIVWDRRLDPANFQRKVLGTPGFVAEVPGERRSGSAGGRPARCYRSGGATVLHPALLRPGTPRS